MCNYAEGREISFSFFPFFFVSKRERDVETRSSLSFSPILSIHRPSPHSLLPTHPLPSPSYTHHREPYMSDYILSPQVSRGLSDKLYDKRKGAALEVERYALCQTQAGASKTHACMHASCIHAYMLSHGGVHGAQVDITLHRSYACHTIETKCILHLHFAFTLVESFAST